MKRHPALVALSHDHHHALVEARRLRRAAAADNEPAAAAAAFRRFFAAVRVRFVLLAGLGGPRVEEVSADECVRAVEASVS